MNSKNFSYCYNKPISWLFAVAETTRAEGREFGVMQQIPGRLWKNLHDEAYLFLTLQRAISVLSRKKAGVKYSPSNNLLLVLLNRPRKVKLYCFLLLSRSYLIRIISFSFFRRRLFGACFTFRLMTMRRKIVRLKTHISPRTDYAKVRSQSKRHRVHPHSTRAYTV